MKPLTIEELKALEVGDWVWIVHNTHKSSYLKKVSNNENQFEFSWFSYSDYGTKWLAYKNKEQAEAEEYKLYCEPAWGWMVNKYIPAHYKPWFTADTKEEAERRLAELKGEK